ncbi:MAG: amino acid adenylation domain-containing protein [Candidatus Aminicenantes bacterium]|nr:amino acid adenylation domain-containing protein [Candidatus Aminicenantes bacterium]
METEGHVNQIYPLSPMQEGILFHSLYDRSFLTYFEQMSFQVSGHLHIESVKKSLDRLFECHDILRTAFVYENTKQPLQVVLKKREADFTYKDLRGLNSKEKEKFIEEFKEKDKQRSFNLTQDVLLRLTILHLADLEYRVTWSFHHILLDGWSWSLLLRQFFEIYNGYVENREVQLPDIIPYQRYIQWLVEQDRERSKAFWKEYLEGYDKKTTIPGFREIDTEKTGYDNQSLAILLGTERTRRLNHYAIKYQVSLSTLIQAVWGILLAKYNAVRDVVYGVVVSGRPAEIKGIETMIGLFINTVPLRITYHPETTFVRLLKTIQEKAVEAEAHHYYPLSEIQAESFLKQNLVNHIFVFENYPVGEGLAEIVEAKKSQGKAPELKITSVDVFEQTNYDLNLLATPGDDLQLNLNYNGNACDPAFIEAMGGHLKQLMDQVLEDEFTIVDELRLLTDEERTRVLYDFNKTEMECTGKTVHQLFAEQVNRTPDNTALTGPGIQGASCHDVYQLTYSELNDRSGHLAHLLQKKGVHTHSIVAVMLERSIEMIIGILGILKAGAAYLPIDPEYPGERVNYMLADSSTKMLLTTSTLAEEGEKVRRWQGEKILLEEIFKSPKSSSYPLTFLPSYPQIPSNPAYLIYTSGSTGKPKGAILEHGNLVNLLIYTFRFTNIDFSVLLQFSTISFDISFQEIFSGLLYGGKIILIDKTTRNDIPLLFEQIKKNKIRTVFLPISFLKVIFSEEEYIERFPGCIRHIVTAGEQVVISDKFGNYLKQEQVYLHNHYGPSETHVVTTYTLEPGGDIPRLPPIGKPVFNSLIYILDNCGNFQPVGVPGELYIGGVQVGRGYLNNPQLTAEKFVVSHPKNLPHDRLYQTGDLAKWLPDGNIEFLGRIDSQVKIRGFRIEPGEVESGLLQHVGVKEAVVTVYENEKNDKYLCAYIVPVGDLVVTAAELREFLSTKFPGYMVPSYFVMLGKIPFTPSRKVDYKSLPAPEIDAVEKYTGPRNVLESGIVYMLADILAIDAAKISIHAHLFDIGVNSITLMIISHRIFTEFNAHFPISALFTNPTIEKIAEDMQKKYPPTKAKHLLLLNEGKTDRNLFLISGDGTTYGFKELAKLLENRFNVYGIQAKGVMEDCPLPETLEELIEGNIQQIKVQQPNGPYLIGGHCYGAILSYYITEVLEQRGDKVEKLILLDELAMLSKILFDHTWLLKVHKWGKIPARRLNGFLKMIAGKKNITNKEKKNEEETYALPKDLELRRKEIQANYSVLLTKMLNHRKIVDAPILHFKAFNPPDPNNSRWDPALLRRQSKQSVEMLNTPGDHHSMFKSPNTAVLAKLMLEKI